jgi:competence protein ComEC
VVIELALMPVAFYHFHRAGVYGALANTVAIPLTTFVSMPLIALALLLDAVGAGAPVWWLAGKSLELLLAIAHWTAARPGAVNTLPAMGEWRFVLFIAGGLWLALWRGRARLLGLIPAGLAVVSMLLLRPPDLLISGDGRHVGITGLGDRLLVLREGRSGYASDTLLEMAGMAGEVRAITTWPGARCTRDFCALDVERGGRVWRLLLARGMDPVPERDLAAACDLADIVVAPRRLPASCRPRWLKADRGMLERSGGLAIDLEKRVVKTVAQGEGEHGWWREPPPRLGVRSAQIRPFLPSLSRDEFERSENRQYRNLADARYSPSTSSGRPVNGFETARSQVGPVAPP